MSVGTDERELGGGYAPQEERSVGSYAVLMGVFAALASGFAAWVRASGLALPDRIDGRDLALLTVASHKASRLITKARVTTPLRAPFAEFQADAGHAEVDEKARGRGLRRAIGELLVCPYCVGMWTSGVGVAGLLAAPRFTRWTCTVLVAFFGSEVLQIAYKKAEDSL